MGEHADNALRNGGVEIIVASVDLGCYALTTTLPPSSHTISITLSDLDSSPVSWDTQSLQLEVANTLLPSTTAFIPDAKLVAVLEV
ncbi:unnamed protein product [Rhizoctonia solani]|uniref:Uncharacterized protein n=1 Tax=Rhizoctonia solani TaxID=456999 RepID=A0A8H3DQM8_9AGAM|nr:unnamed protein product [Rhizoctonia solani]